MTPTPGGDPVGVRFRRPVDADHAAVAARIDGWWSGRRGRALIARAWFRHATRTSWVAETDDGTLLGFAIALPGPDDPATGLLHAVAVSPARRRRGIGSALVTRVAGDLRLRGARRIEAIGWPDDPVAVRFLVASGFRPESAQGTMPLYGTPAYPDYEGEGEDRTRFLRDL